MKKIFTLFICALFALNLAAQEVEKIYLLPGQGGDGRLFQNLDLSPFEVEIINYSDTIPKKGETLPQYAARIAKAIDTTERFALVGVSFGGMIAVEIADILETEKVFIISSAKNKKELPKHFDFVRRIRLHNAVPGKVSIKMSHFVRPLFEPSIRRDKLLFKSMVEGKDPRYLKRAIKMLIEWERTENTSEIIHIHGTEDNTLPFKKIKNPVEIEEGSHMMVVFRAEEIRSIILEHLTN